MKRLLALSLLLVCLSGCGEIVIPVEEEDTESLSFEAKPVPREVTEDKTPPAQQDFADAAEAIAVLKTATESQNRDQQNAAVAWLSKQGSSAVPPLSDALGDSTNSAEFRRLLCIALARSGTAGVPALLKATNDAELPVRLKAIEVLGSVEPTREIVSKLMVLMEDSNEQVQRTAIRTLGNIGTPAKAAAKKLQQLRNSTTVNETIRGEADRALKAVRPIATFND